MQCRKCGEPLEVRCENERIACPRCGKRYRVARRASLPAAPPVTACIPSHSEQVMRRNMIQASELLDFLHDLPDRPLKRRFPYGDEWQQLNASRQELAQLHPRAFVFDSTFSFVAVTARKLNGWACLEYDRAAPLIVRFVLANELLVQEDNAALVAVERLRDIEARLEIGASREQYHELISRSWVKVRDVISSRQGLFYHVLRATFEDYRLALDIWNGHEPLSFRLVGGGFGIRDAIQGIAIAEGVNFLLRAIDDGMTNDLHKHLQALWLFASLKLRVLEEVLGLPSPG